MLRSGASGCGLKGSLQASHQWSVLPFCLPQISQLNVSVQLNGEPRPQAEKTAESEEFNFLQ